MGDEGYLKSKMTEQNEKIIKLEQEVKILNIRMNNLKDNEELLSVAENFFINKELIVKEIMKMVSKINYEQTKKNFEHQKNILNKQMEGTIKELMKEFKNKVDEIQKENKILFNSLKANMEDFILLLNSILSTLEKSNIDTSVIRFGMMRQKSIRETEVKKLEDS